ncbi:MAG: hypothetical protein P8Y45_12485 [Exilibacterium sp.]
MPQFFYRDFAHYLATQGYHVWTFDYRGTGEPLKGSMRRSAPLMWHLLAPLLCPPFGYFPGERLGVIGNIPSAAMFQWRRFNLRVFAEW